MKHLFLGTILATAALTLPGFAQEPDAEKEQEAKMADWVNDFNNLPEAQRAAFAEGFRDASRMFEQKRVFESIRQLEEIEDIFEDHPQLANLKGACYVEFRDFEEAQKYFSRALELSPGNMSVRFNVAEVAFVRGRWDKAYEKLSEIVDGMDDKSSGSAHLCYFKMFICATKAGKAEKAKELANRYEELFDDSPYFYCVKVVESFEDGDPVAAQRWMKSADTVYSRHEVKSRDLTAFKDALIEAGYLESFYGSEHDGEEPNDQ